MKKILLTAIGSILLAGCAQSDDTAARVVERYFQTLVEKEEIKIVELSCITWEADARRDILTFAEYPAVAENVKCRETGDKKGELTVVACTGKLVLDYNGDMQEINLADREYVAGQEDGAWRMCGYR